MTQFDGVFIDEDGLFARSGDRLIRPSRHERAILTALMRHPRRLMTRSRLLDEVQPDAQERSPVSWACSCRSSTSAIGNR